MTDRPEPQDTDEALSALIDGELDHASALALHERMAADPALAARFAALQAASARFTADFRALDDVPLPAGVLALLEASDAQAEPDNVVTLPRRAAAGPLRTLPLALAAGIALVVGFLAAQLIGPLAPGRADGQPAWLADGAIAPASRLFDVLEHRPSGTVAELADGAAATPVLTFARAGGGFCRELQVRSTAGSSRAVACRGDESWQVQVAEFTPAAASAGYQAASQAESAVATTIARLREGPALDAASEAELLGSWQR